MIFQTAVAGALAATLTATPAAAPAPPVAPHERHRIAPVRVAPTQNIPPSHVVQPGDTVAGIAGRYGLRTTDVLGWNSLSWRSVIYPGQTLHLHAPASASAPTPTPAPAATKTHTVVAGDTVFGIARKYATSVGAILAANGLPDGAIIYPGQKIVVSGGAASASPPAPAAAPAAAPATPPQSGGSAHTVAAGETLFSIAQRYGTTTQSLFAWNGLGPSSIIYPGQRLAVQAPAPKPAAAPTGQRSATLTAEQAANAALIIRVGRELGVSDRGIAIALATGMVESDLRNLDWGIATRSGSSSSARAPAGAPRRRSWTRSGARESSTAARATRTAHHPRTARHRGLGVAALHRRGAGRADLRLPRSLRAVGGPGVRMARPARVRPPEIRMARGVRRSRGFQPFVHRLLS